MCFKSYPQRFPNPHLNAVIADSYNYKGCGKYPTKTQFFKSYVQATAKWHQYWPIHLHPAPKKEKIPHKNIIKCNSSPTQQFNKLQELSYNIPKIVEIIMKIKKDLQAKSFDKIMQKLNCVLTHLRLKRSSLKITWL